MRGICHERLQPFCDIKFHISDWPSVPCALLHCGANKLANQGQELLCVPRMELLQQSEQSQDEWRPVHRVGRFPADHACEGEVTTPGELLAFDNIH